MTGANGNRKVSFLVSSGHARGHAWVLGGAAVSYLPRTGQCYQCGPALASTGPSTGAVVAQYRAGAGQLWPGTSDQEVDPCGWPQR